MSLGEILERTTGPIYSTCFSPSGEFVAWGARSGEVKITTLRSRSTQLNETYSDSIYAIAFSDDSTSLLVALQTQARLISVASGESRAMYEHSEIETAAFSPDQELTSFLLIPRRYSCRDLRRLAQINAKLRTRRAPLLRGRVLAPHDNSILIQIAASPFATTRGCRNIFTPTCLRFPSLTTSSVPVRTAFVLLEETAEVSNWLR